MKISDHDYAEERARQMQVPADGVDVDGVKEVSAVSAFFRGCPKAMGW